MIDVIRLDGVSPDFAGVLQELVKVHRREFSLIQETGQNFAPAARGSSAFCISAPRIISLGLSPVERINDQVMNDKSLHSEITLHNGANSISESSTPLESILEYSVPVRQQSESACSSHIQSEARSVRKRPSPPPIPMRTTSAYSCRQFSGGLSPYCKDIFTARSSYLEPPLRDDEARIQDKGVCWSSDAVIHTISRSGIILKNMQTIHFALEDPERTSWKTSLMYVMMPSLVCLNIVVALLQSIDPCPIDRRSLRIFEMVLSGVFFLDALIRVAVYPKWNFFHSFSTSHFFLLIDVAAAIPFGLFISLDLANALDNSNRRFGAKRFLLLCLSPLLRLLKILRYTRNVHLLSHAAFLLLEAVPSMMFVMVVIMWFFASLLVLVEPVENVESLPHAMWMCIITMTTVGYGDVYPTTLGGYFICGSLAIASLLYMAMPLGIIGSIFTSVWEDRHRFLLMHTVRTRLAQAGYLPEDVPAVFSRFDANGTGELDVFAFNKLIETLDIGLDEKRVLELFERFDVDKSGAITAVEFVRFLFPHTFHKLYGKEGMEDISLDDHPETGA